MKSRIVVTTLALVFSTSAWSEYALLDSPIPNSAERLPIALSELPLDKSWEQFTAEDRARLRSEYATLADNEEPPFPRDGLKAIIDNLRVVQKKNSLEGDMFAVITVDEQGNARSVSYLETPNVGEMEAVTGILTRAKYKPAKCADRPCTMEFPLHIFFKLKHSLVF